MSESIVYRSCLSPLSYRAESDGEPAIVEGLGLPYEQWTEVDSQVEGHFMERWHKGASWKTLSERADRIRILFEHGFSKLFDKAPVAQLRDAWEEEDGVHFRAELLSGLPGFFIDGLRKGQYSASVGFRAEKFDQRRHPGRSAFNPKGIEEREVREARIREFSITPFPVYEGTAIAMRSITDELAVEQLAPLVVDVLVRERPEELLQLIRQSKDEAEPTHSVPEAQEGEEPEPEPETPPPAAEAPPESQPAQEPEPDPQGSRDTQPPPKDYLSEAKEEEWRL